MKNILIVAPHCDDEVLGCGGAISHYNNNNYKVNVCVMTNASKSNNSNFNEDMVNQIRKEAIRAHKYLKINNTFFFNFPAPNLDQFPVSIIAEKISKLVHKIKPEIVFIPFAGDSHVDHRVVNEASLVALRPISKFIVMKIYAYETLSETEWGDVINRSSFTPNFFIRLSKKDIDKKAKAMQIYKSQLKKYPHPRSEEGIINLAKYRGQSISQKLAESFMLIRDII